ncbi:MAG TPA: glycosyltransferase family 39 protein [Gaiellaceae bacterium]
MARVVPAVAYPLWQDEVASARIMDSATVGAALDRIEQTESTPPLWYLLAWTVHRTGLPVEAARGIGVAAGALLAGLLVVYGRRFLPLWGAGLAGLAVAVAGPLVLRGAELRAYSLYACLALAFGWLLERAATRPRRGRLLALAAVAAAGLLTHYFFAFVLIAGLTWLWTSPLGRTARTRASLATAAGIVPFLVWTPSLAEQVENQRYSWISGFSLVKVVAVYSAFGWNPGPLYVANRVDLGTGETVLRAAVFLLVVAGCVVLWGLGPRGRLTALLAVGPVALAALLWIGGENLFTSRNVLASAPFAALALAALATSLPRGFGPAAGVVLLAVVVGGAVHESRLAPPPYDRVAASLVALGWKDGDRLAIFPDPDRPSYLGSIYGFRGPVGWYLPGHPEPRLSAGGPCVRAFAVVPGSVPPSRGNVEERATVDGVNVLRVSCSRGFDDDVRAGGGLVFVPRRD